MIKSLLGLLVLSTVGTSAFACEPMPLWHLGSSEIKAVLSAAPKIISKLEAENKELNAFYTTIKGVELVEGTAYRVSLFDKWNKKSCSVEVELKYVIIEETKDLPCGPFSEPKVQSIGQLNCKE